MPNRLYQSSSCSNIAVNGAGTAWPMGLVDNLRLEMAYVTEGVIEIGSFEYSDILIHGYGARFSWGRAYPAGGDIVSMGLAPSRVNIPQYTPILIRVIDQIGQREIALIHRGVLETYTVELNGRAKLMSNVSGIACALLVESEIN